MERVFYIFSLKVALIVLIEHFDVSFSELVVYGVLNIL